MSNPNTVTIFSPEGEPFEMSRVNARDLVNHAGWTNAPQDAAPAAAADEAEQAADETQTEDTTDASTAGAGSDEAAAEDDAEAEAGEAGDEAEEAGDEDAALTSATPFKTAEEFAALTTREELVGYLANNFPDFRPHHKQDRDKLVAKAVELANAE